MQTIYKYPIAVVTEQEIMLPAGGKILCAQAQKEFPHIWVMVDSEQQHHEPVTILTFGTGHDCNAAGNYIGTYQLRNGDLVYHVFEAKK